MFMNESLFVDFLNNREVLWTGINFAKAKFTKQGFDFPQEIIQHYLHDWNMLILNDQKKYDIRMSFRKPVMQYDLSLVTKANKGVKVGQLLTNHIDLKDILSEELLADYMKKFVYPHEFRYALTFVVESFDSATKMASIWVVLSVTASGEIVLCEKFLKTPGGFGTRNYWARTFYNLLYDIKTYAFLRWENMVQGHQPESAPTSNTSNQQQQ
jgi:hypothetical protein